MCVSGENLILGAIIKDRKGLKSLKLSQNVRSTYINRSHHNNETIVI